MDERREYVKELKRQQEIHNQVLLEQDQAHIQKEETQFNDGYDTAVLDLIEKGVL